MTYLIFYQIEIKNDFSNYVAIAHFDKDSVSRPCIYFRFLFGHYQNSEKFYNLIVAED